MAYSQREHNFLPNAKYILKHKQQPHTIKIIIKNTQIPNSKITLLHPTCNNLKIISQQTTSNSKIYTQPTTTKFK